MSVKIYPHNYFKDGCPGCESKNFGKKYCEGDIWQDDGYYPACCAIDDITHLHVSCYSCGYMWYERISSDKSRDILLWECKTRERRDLILIGVFAILVLAFLVLYIYSQ